MNIEEKRDILKDATLLGAGDGLPMFKRRRVDLFAGKRMSVVEVAKEEGVSASKVKKDLKGALNAAYKEIRRANS